MSKEATGWSFQDWGEAIGKRKPVRENEAKGGKYRLQHLTIEMGGYDLGGGNPQHDAGPPLFEEPQIGMT